MRVLAIASLACQLFLVQGVIHVCLPQTAAAQRGGGGDDAEYRSVIEEALQEFNRGNWEEAGALFERAHRLNPSARTLRGMGLTAYEARRYVDAIRHLNEALGETRRPLTQAQRDEVSATLDRARRFVAHLRLNVGPSHAKVTINGRPAEPDSKGDVATDPGLLDVEISAEGYEPALRRVRLTAGGQEELNVQLSRVRTESEVTAPTQQPATAPTAATQPSAPVDDGNVVGTLKWVVGGVAVAGLIAGTVLVLYQQSEARDYMATCTKLAPGQQPPLQCPAWMQRVGGTLTTAPIIAFSVGGGLAAVATVLFIVDAADDPSDAPTARNGCDLGGPGELGVQCRLAF